MSNLIDTCTFCNSTETITETHFSGKHWGSLSCRKCGRHLRWLPNPSVTTEFEERKQIIDLGLASGQVTAWESLFLRSIRLRRHLSPKQKEKFQQVCTRHGMKIPAYGGAGSG